MADLIVLKQQVIDRIDQLKSFADQRFTKIFTRHPIKIQRPRVMFSKLGTTAGTFNASTWTITINTVLLEENGQDFIDRTVVHEFAHACQHHWTPSDFSGRKRQIHGRNFKWFMRQFGADGSTYHSYDVSSVKKNVKEFVWVSTTDKSVTMTLGTKRHNKMRQGRAKYFPRGFRHHDFEFSHIKDNGVTTFKRPTPKNSPANVPNSLSKIDICRNFMRINSSTSRKYLIDKFVEIAGCTPAGAATYYAKLKKEFV